MKERNLTARPIIIKLRWHEFMSSPPPGRRYQKAIGLYRGEYMYQRNNKSKAKAKAPDGAPSALFIEECEAAIAHFEKITGINRREYDYRLGQAVMDVVKGGWTQSTKESHADYLKRMADARTAATVLMRTGADLS